ncbi:MAG: AtpZ/AtpI family protein [Flavobacteriales bacterium AspAUS03]
MSKHQVEKPSQKTKHYFIYISLPMQMATVIAGGASLGQWLDILWNHNEIPCLSIIFSLFGLLISLYFNYKSIN